ncbi:MAG: hypothetical protein V3S41_05310 [Spirochaetia bacterium]
MTSGSKAPRWKLDTVYLGYESDEYRRDRAELIKAARALVTKLDDSASRKKTPEKWLAYLLKKLNTAHALYANLESYIYCRYATDTLDEKTVAELNSLEEDVLQLKEAEVRLRNELLGLRKQLPGLYKRSKIANRFRVLPGRAVGASGQADEPYRRESGGRSEPCRRGCLGSTPRNHLLEFVGSLEEG